VTTVVCACVRLWGSAGLPRYLSVETLPAADAAREEGCAARGARGKNGAHRQARASLGWRSGRRGRSALVSLSETVARVSLRRYSTVEFLARSYPHAAMYYTRCLYVVQPKIDSPELARSDVKCSLRVIYEIVSQDSALPLVPVAFGFARRWMIVAVYLRYLHGHACCLALVTQRRSASHKLSRDAVELALGSGIPRARRSQR